MATIAADGAVGGAQRPHRESGPLAPRAAAHDPEPDELRAAADGVTERDAPAGPPEEEAAGVRVSTRRVVAAAREAQCVQDAMLGVAPDDRDPISPGTWDRHDHRWTGAAADDHSPLREPPPGRRPGLGGLRHVLARRGDGSEDLLRGIVPA